MKKLWLPVCLMVTATVFYSNEDNQFDATTTRMPTERVTDAGMKTVVHREPGCTAVDSFFAEEVWGKVGERSCLKCHNAKGDAAESEFVLQETLQDHTALEKNRQAFLRLATAQEDGKSRLL